MNQNSLLTFLFSLIPGAGEMYLGMMKKGIVVMSVFGGIIAISAFLRLELFLFALPVIWFYSFFDTWNASRLSLMDRRILDAQFSFGWGNTIAGDWKKFVDQRHVWIGAALIVLGFWLILQNFLMYTDTQLLPSWIRQMLWQMPSILAYTGIIILGIHLVKGKKKPAQTQEPEFVAFKGEDHE